MTAQPCILPTTVALITDDATGGFVQLTDLDQVDTHVAMLTAQGRDCTVWVRRQPLPAQTADTLAEVELEETVRDAWRQR